MASLVVDGGPSVTRYSYLRTVEIVSIGWFSIVIAVVVRYVHTGLADGGVLALIGTLAATLLTATALNQNTKLTLDNAPKGDPSKVSTPGATVTQGDQSDQAK
jgi:hypothetical protein